MRRNWDQVVRGWAEKSLVRAGTGGISQEPAAGRCWSAATDGGRLAWHQVTTGSYPQGAARCCCFVRCGRCHHNRFRIRLGVVEPDGEVVLLAPDVAGMLE